MPDRVPGADETEIAAIFARLQEEVRTRRPADEVNRIRAVGNTPLGGRSRAEQTWSVTAERPFEQSPNRPLRRYLLAPVKHVLRKLMRWYVEPVAAQQRSFNLAILTVVDELADRVEADRGRLERRFEALEERLGSEQSGHDG
jgi:hypothetical protein